MSSASMALSEVSGLLGGLPGTHSLSLKTREMPLTPSAAWMGRMAGEWSCRTTQRATAGATVRAVAAAPGTRSALSVGSPATLQGSAETVAAADAGAAPVPATDRALHMAAGAAAQEVAVAVHRGGVAAAAALPLHTAVNLLFTHQMQTGTGARGAGAKLTKQRLEVLKFLVGDKLVWLV